MRKLAVLALVLTALLTGCGGGGGSSVPSPFAGAWTGSLAMADGSGPDPNPLDIQMNVDSRGHITGSWVDPTASGSFTGTVAPGGHMKLDIAYAGPPPVTMPCEGNTTLVGSGAWQGTLPVTDAEGAGMVVTLDATRQ